MKKYAVQYTYVDKNVTIVVDTLPIPKEEAVATFIYYLEDFKCRYQKNEQPDLVIWQDVGDFYSTNGEPLLKLSYKDEPNSIPWIKAKILELLENTLDDYYPLVAEGQYCIGTASMASTIAEVVAEIAPYISWDIEENELDDVVIALRELIEGEVLSYDVVDWPNPENEQMTVSVLRLFVIGNDGEDVD